jgi:hypothetical protein
MSAQSARDWLLKIAQEVEDDPTRCTRGELARYSDGKATSPASQFAICWCAIGFLHRDNALEGFTVEFRDAVIAALRQSGQTLTGNYNDSLKSSADFVAWFRRAAELCT